MEIISKNLLHRLMKESEKFLLINVLSKDEFKKEHIPNSININFTDDDFVQRVESICSTKAQKIIVYCHDNQCDCSKKAAKTLDEAGFSFVMRYPGGIEEWKESSFPVEMGKVHRRR